MKLQIVSDLHLEFSDVTIPNAGADVLVLSGDIMLAESLYKNVAEDFDPYKPGAMATISRRVSMSARFLDFLRRVSEAFPHVIYVAGNHEFYHFRWFQTLEVLKEVCDRFSNVYFLERDCKKIDDVTFVGGTLWTDMNRNDPLTLHAVRDMMNDYSVIRNDKAGFTSLKPIDTAIRHSQTVGYIKTVVEGKADEKFVVVGHHAPSKVSTHEKYKNDQLMNGAYSSDLSEFILDHPQIKLWTCGHTHHAHWYYIGETLITCNPRGYEGYEGNTGWNKNFLVDLENLPDKDYVLKNYGNLF